jgi:lipoprotein NlpD
MRKSLFVLSGLCLVLASCAGTTAGAGRGPRASGRIILRTGRCRASACSAAVRPGHHQVAKGDTLYSIALEHGQDWRDLVIWNRLENPNLIRIGQEVRVTPPEGAVETQPIAASSAVESRPIQPIAAIPPVRLQRRSQ